MDKKDLIPGKTYLRRHKTTVHGRYGNKITLPPLSTENNPEDA